MHKVELHQYSSSPSRAIFNIDFVNAANVDVALQREMTEKDTKSTFVLLKATAAW